MLRSICEQEDVASRSLDPVVVEQLVSRLADLRAAESLADLLAGSPTLAQDQATLTIDLSKGFQMKLKINHQTLPVDGGGRLAKARVRRLQVVEIGQLP